MDRGGSLCRHTASVLRNQRVYPVQAVGVQDRPRSRLEILRSHP